MASPAGTRSSPGPAFSSGRSAAVNGAAAPAQALQEAGRRAWRTAALAAEPPERPAAVQVPPPSSPLLVAVFQPQGRQIELRARLLLPAAPALQPLDVPQGEALLEALAGAPTSLALLQDPAQLAAQPLLRPLLERCLGLRPPAGAERQGPLPPLLASTLQGPLLASNGPAGWLLGGSAGDPEPAVLEPLLAREGLVEAPLALDGHQLTVWTRLSFQGRAGRRERAGGDELQASLAGWREQRQSQAWWGQSLASLQTSGQARSLVALRRGLRDLQEPAAPLQWSLDGDGARAVLRSWQPWRLLSALAGGGLDGPVQGLALAVDARPEAPALELRARLALGH